jgi:putative nucleotidyltransferase-like protein
MAGPRAKQSKGELIARALAGAWRDAPDSLALRERELEEITPMLLVSGSAALVWRRLRESGRAGEAERLREAHRFYALQEAVYERRVKQAFALLRSAGIEAVLVKGWAIARLYPEKGMRSFCDIDLCVRPAQYRAAAEVLAGAGTLQGFVDLHDGFGRLLEESDEELFARSEVVGFDDTEVRVFGAEEHLRLLCVHLLRHGVWRPVWLCDIAVIMESRPPHFDWGRCLGQNPRVADWVACAIGLTHQLLETTVAETPVERRARRLPAWLVPTVLRQWSVKYKSRTPTASFLRRPRALVRELRHHWPNGIEATVNVQGPFNRLPRLPFQLGDCFQRTGRFMAQLPRLLREPPNR